MKDPHLVSFSPMHHWTEHNILVHLFTCVPALAIAHLMRRHAAQHQVKMSARVLLDTLAGIEETVLIYPSTEGRPTGASGRDGSVTDGVRYLSASS